MTVRNTHFFAMQNTFWIGNPPVPTAAALLTLNKTSCTVTAQLGHQSISLNGRDSGDSGDYDQSDDCNHLCDAASAARIDSSENVFMPALLNTEAHRVLPQNGCKPTHGAADLSIEPLCIAQQLDWV